MLIKPSKEDWKVIGYYLGRIIIGLGFTMLIPLLTGLFSQEWNPALDYGISILFCMILGEFLISVCRTSKDLTWVGGMTVTSLSWLVAMVIGAIPLYLSGHYLSFLDSCFDAMSGIATTGLALAQDIDHFSNAHNMWRHFIMFLGGQGIIVASLTFLMRGTSGAYRMYVGEAREEKILPNVISTARFIWSISIIYLIIGTLALSVILAGIGMPLIRSFLHAMWLFMAGFDTGGFTPQSQSVLYYHNFYVELATIIFMLLGTINFSLHFAFWSGNFREIRKNIEIFALGLTLSLTSLAAMASLIKYSTYPTWISILRKGFYQIVSAHSGTGFMTVYASQFNEWGSLGIFMVIIAMGLGGSACSTAGGIKALRIGLSYRSLIHSIRTILSPGSAIIVEKFHHIKDLILNDTIARSTLLITLLYLVAYLAGTGMGVFYGYSLQDSAFESVSACANVGLSIGVTQPSMPAGLKITYILQMWMGRLEFMSVLALIGFIVSAVRGK